MVYLVDRAQLGIGIEHRRLTLLGKYLHVQRADEENPKRERIKKAEYSYEKCKIIIRIGIQIHI